MTQRIPLGITSYTYRYAVRGGHLDAWQLVQRAVELGLQVLQFLDNMPLDLWPDEDLRALGRAAAGRLALHVGMAGLDGGQLARYLAVAQLCGAEQIRVTVQGGIDEACRTLQALLPALRAAGVTVGIENHFRQSADQLLTLVRRLNDPHVAICLDTLNSIALLEGPGETVARLAPYAVCLHLKDGTTLREGQDWRVRGTALGAGLLDLEALVRTVWAAGRRPPMLLEMWQDPEADEVATLAAEEAQIAQSLDYMRQLAALPDVSQSAGGLVDTVGASTHSSRNNP